MRVVQIPPRVASVPVSRHYEGHGDIRVRHCLGRPQETPGVGVCSVIEIFSIEQFTQGIESATLCYSSGADRLLREASAIAFTPLHLSYTFG